MRKFKIANGLKHRSSKRVKLLDRQSKQQSPRPKWNTSSNISSFSQAETCCIIKTFWIQKHDTVPRYARSRTCASSESRYLSLRWEQETWNSWEKKWQRHHTACKALWRPLPVWAFQTFFAWVFKVKLLLQLHQTARVFLATIGKIHKS